MQRRQILVSLGALLSAGCLGAKPPETASSVRTEGSVTQGTLTATPQPTATPESTETPEPTPESTETSEPADSEEDVDAGDDAIERVQTAFTAAVEAYTGSEDGSPASVSLASGSFDVRSVLLELDTVQTELVAAETAAVTDDQRETVAALETAERFLTHAALVHSYFAESVDRLDTTYAAFGDDIDAVEDAENRFDDTLDRGSSGVSTIKNDLEADAVAVADPFDDDTYDETISMFESVRDALDDASSGLDRMIQGADELEDARDEEDDNNDDEAADKAEEARDLFDEAYDRFDDAADVAGDVNADDLESILESLRAVANDYYVDADDVYQSTS